SVFKGVVRCDEAIQAEGAEPRHSPDKPNRPTGLLRYARNDEIKREAERRQTHVFTSASYGCGARSSERARLSASHRGSVPRGLSSPRFCFRPGFLGRSRNCIRWTGVTRPCLSQSREAPP